jgi:hypothetical protein
VKPQSEVAVHFDCKFVFASAFDETWKSEKTTRPYWFAGSDGYGVLNVKLGLNDAGVTPLPVSFATDQSCVVAPSVTTSWRASWRFSVPSCEDAPTSRSHCANAAPFVKL